MSLSVDFYQIDGRYSFAPASTCHYSFSVPRRLADKKSDSESTIKSDKILPSSSSESRFYSKPKKSELILAQNFTFIGMEILTQQNLVRVPADRVETLSNLFSLAIKYRHELSFLFWANSVQQQILFS